ncbi:ankyrin repeat-containing domain protein, partial [Podospora didyma]
SPDGLEDVERMVSVCAGLVTIDEESDIIRLVHYTTQEYFEQTQKQWFPDAQDDISLACLTYLTFNTFEHGMCTTDSEFEERLRSNPLFDYVARHWAYHVSSARSMPAEVFNFLASRPHVGAYVQLLMAKKLWEGQTGYGQYRVPIGKTGLHLATVMGYEIRVLLTDTKDIDESDIGDRIHLSWATQYEHDTVTKLLLEIRRVDADSKNDYDCTPLIHVIIGGWTTLMYPSEKGHGDAVNLLLEYGANVHHQDEKGQTALLWASRKGYEKVVRYLVDKGADLSFIDENISGPSLSTPKSEGDGSYQFPHQSHTS